MLGRAFLAAVEFRTTHARLAIPYRTAAAAEIPVADRLGAVASRPGEDLGTASRFAGLVGREVAIPTVGVEVVVIICHLGTANPVDRNPALRRGVCGPGMIARGDCSSASKNLEMVRVGPKCYMAAAGCRHDMAVIARNVRCPSIPSSGRYEQ